MKMEKIRKLEKKGWKVGTVAEFLNLTAEEEEYIELKVALSNLFQELRKKKKLTQNQVAELIKSSQSRVAKIEKADESVSLDLMVKSIYALGSTNREIGRIMLKKSA